MATSQPESGAIPPPLIFAPSPRRGIHPLITLALVLAVPVIVLLASHPGAGARSLKTAASARSAQRGAGVTGAGATAHAITLNWVGDIAVSSAQGLPPGGVEQALGPVRPLLRDADLTLGNLEGTLSSGGASKCGGPDVGECFAFQAPPDVAGQLRALGFGLVNQANNHSLDYGPGGRRQTLASLQQYGLAYTGLPGQITVLPVDGVRVAFLGFAPYRYDSDLRNISAAQAMIRTARREAAIVVVIIHAGAEGADQVHTPTGEETFLGEDRGDTRAFAHAAIDAGASIVVGSGPHVPRGVEAYRGHLIAYSLGNFVGYRTLGLGGVLSDSGILHVELGPTGSLLAARLISLQLVDGLPRPDPSDTTAKLVASLSDEDFPQDHFVIDAQGVFHP